MARRRGQTPVDGAENTSRSSAAGSLEEMQPEDAGSRRLRPKYVDGVRNTSQGLNEGGPNEDYVHTTPMSDDGDASDPVPTRTQSRPLDPVEFQSRVHKSYEEAETYVDTTLAPDRIEAAEYYKGAPFGDEQDGRSQIVLTEVRDTILSILPSLLRIFTSGDRVVEFMPRRPDAVGTAVQATEGVAFVFSDMNPGFQILHSWFKDALLKKIGVVTWWAEKEDRVVEREFSGLLEEEIMLFQQNNPNAQFIAINPEPPLMGQNAPPTYTVRVQLIDRERRYRVRCLPPEQFVFDRRARDTDKFFDCIGWRDMVTVSELVQMGFDEDEVREHGAPGQDENWYWNFEEVERNPGFAWPNYPTDPSMMRVKYMQIYMRIDKDGDGIAELRRIHAIGSGCYILRDEVVDEAPFAVLTPDPEPHAMVGHSIFDATKDIQRIKSHVLRATMDSLAQSIFPRTAVVESMVNIDDVLNKEVGAIVRMRQIGAVQDLSTPFVGQAAMPVLDYLDGIKAQRTGVTPASAGLDPDILQSTTQQAVNATISSAQERIEVIARIFAETGVKQLFRGLLRLVCRHQDKPLFIKLRGQWMPVDPTTWDADMDCAVTVGLGRGDDMQQMAFLTQIAQKQEQVLQVMGLDNPLVKLQQYSQTLNQLTRKAGFKNSAAFFSEITPEQQQQLEQQAAAQRAQQVDPNVLLAKVELAKTQADTFAKLEKQGIERVKLQLEEDLKRDQLDADVILRGMDIAGKYGTPVDIAHIMQLINRPRPDIQQLADTLIAREKAVNAAVLAQIGVQSQDPGQVGGQPAQVAPQNPGQQPAAGASPLAQHMRP